MFLGRLGLAAVLVDGERAHEMEGGYPAFEVHPSSFNQMVVVNYLEPIEGN